MNLDNAKLIMRSQNNTPAISSNKRDIESTKLDISMAERKIAELTEEMKMSIVTTL